MFKKIFYNNFLYLTIIFAAVCFEVYFSYLFKVGSQNLESFEENYQNQTIVNLKLKEEVAKFSSLSNIKKRAKNAGFIEAQKIIYLPSGDIFAENLK
jgi:cell division protein FtsL